MKLLIVEDERELSDNIVSYLSSENYVCEQAFSYEEAGMKTGLYDYDCVVLDLMLPGGNGLDLLRELRRRRNPVGVIIVSAKDSLDDKIKGLELGADDYLSKPFHLAELSMRIYALIRRKEFAANNTLWSNGIEINLPGKSVRVDGCPVVLTRMQYERLLFNRFYRPSEQVKGNGLGLAIVRAICQYHGWKVSYSYTGRHCFTVDFS